MSQGCAVRRGPSLFVPVVLLAAAVVVLGLAGCAGGRVAAPPAAGPVAMGPCAPTCPPAGPPPCPPCPDGKGGEVWCRVWIPPVLSTVTEEVCVKPEACRKVWIPPQYGTRPKLCCVSPAQLTEHVTPPVWTTRTQDVIVCPEREGWRPICCPPAVDGCAPAPQECWIKECTPPVWGQEACPVCVAPERYCVEYTPAKYEVVEERYLIRAGRCEEIREPAVYEQRCRQVCVCPGRWEWRRNTACEVPLPAPIAAIQVEMKDVSEGGTEEGRFRVGEVVRYDLRIAGDSATDDMPGVQVEFSLPPEMEFVSGEGPGITVQGSGQSARTSTFTIPKAGEVRLEVKARVKSAPASNLVQFTAAIRAADGSQVAVESESTTVSSD